MSLEAVIFDVDGVLVDSREANIALFQNLLTHAGYEEAEREDILGCFHLPLWQSLERLTGASDQQEIPLNVVAPLITLGLNELQRRTTKKLMKRLWN